jgi:hypothetical protein
VTIDGGDAEGGPATESRASGETDRHRRARHEALEAPALGWAVEILQAQVVEIKVDE